MSRENGGRRATRPAQDGPADRLTAQARSGVLDRRPVSQGDQRREALLAALDELLHETDLAAVTIADITARAGVTRSAFYFYFENKEACVAALGADIYRGAIAAADHLADASVPPVERIERMVDDLFRAVRDHHYLYRASYEARRHSAAIREMWEGYLQSFQAPVARFIDTERDGGRAPKGPHSSALAQMILSLTDRVLEDLAPQENAADRRRADALATIWLRSIYGTQEYARPRRATTRRRSQP